MTTNHTVRVFHYDAFSTIPHKGNPAGVVLDGEALTEEQMLAIAHKVGFNETAFVVPSSVATLRIRYFTPGHEMNLCGHGTMATLSAMVEHGLLNVAAAPLELTVETLAGVLPMRIERTDAGPPQITMRQAAPQFRPFEGSVDELAAAIGLMRDDIDESFPILYGSTGIWTLLVPIERLESFACMRPKNEAFPSVLKEMPRASIHPFCRETHDPMAQMHGRHFSSPYSGTVEDPVTGTASGVMGAYYVQHVLRNDGQSGTHRVVVEQGQEIGRDGRVVVEVSQFKDETAVSIKGQAVLVGEFEVAY